MLKNLYWIQGRKDSKEVNENADIIFEYNLITLVYYPTTLLVSIEFIRASIEFNREASTVSYRNYSN